jgi:hypothetical protein
MAQDPNNSLVESVPTVVLHRDHQGPETDDFLATNYKDGRGGQSPVPTWSSDPRVSFQHLTVEMLWWQNHVHKLKLPTEEELKQAGYLHAWFFHPPIVDCPQMLMVGCSLFALKQIFEQSFFLSRWVE